MFTDVQVLSLRCMDVLLMVHGFMFLFVSPTMHPLATTRSFTNNIQVNITDTIATLTDYW